MLEDMMFIRLNQILGMIKTRKKYIGREDRNEHLKNKYGVDYLVAVDKDINDLYSYAEVTLRTFGFNKQMIKQFYK